MNELLADERKGFGVEVQEGESGLQGGVNGQGNARQLLSQLNRRDKILSDKQQHKQREAGSLRPLFVCVSGFLAGVDVATPYDSRLYVLH